MSDLDDLIDAARAKPSSGLLRVLVATARGGGGHAAAGGSFLAGSDPAPHDPATRDAVASFLIDQSAPAAALSWTEGQEGGLALLHARALLGLGREREARDSYVAALALFPHLRDAALDDRLATAQARTVAAGGSQARDGSEPGGNVVSITMQRRPADPRPDAAVPERDAERIGFDQIGGLDEVKSQIRRRIILPFERKGLFDRFRKRAGGGVLLYGPPGCGKTLMARATAGECGATFVPVEITDVLDKFIGESEKRVAAIFSNARAKKPTVLFFDEVEALAARRRFAENNHHAPMVSTFLNEMDGLKGDNEGLLILAATNTPWAIDTAFRRPGRFDRALFIPPPDRAAREAILRIALRDRPAEADLRLGDIAERTGGFSGADLSHVVETACDLAIERSIKTDRVAPISAADLRAAAKEVKPTTVEWLTQARNYAKFANEGGFYDDVAAFLDKHGR